MHVIACELQFNGNVAASHARYIHIAVVQADGSEGQRGKADLAVEADPRAIEPAKKRARSTKIVLVPGKDTIGRTWCP